MKLLISQNGRRKLILFGLTNNQDLINAAIQLSYYEDDTEESDELIRKCKKYYKKITENE